MSELKIDEQELALLGNHVEELLLNLEADLKTLIDKDADIFNRYMSYSRLSGMMLSATNYIRIAKHCFHLGHHLHHSVFDTEQRKHHKWDLPRVEENPFFVQLHRMEAEAITIKEDDMTPELKEQIDMLIAAKHKKTPKH